MRILYHFPLSPYSRRTRLMLAHKGVAVELRDARNDDANLAAARRVTPLGTMPVFVEEDGRALFDSMAIALYLDRAYPEPPLFPRDAAEAREVAHVITSVDRVLATLVDLGTRYYGLADHAKWPAVTQEPLTRAAQGLADLGARVSGLGRETIAKSGYGIGDMWLATAVLWLDGLPARAPTFALAAQIISLGVPVPSALSRWVEAHRPRVDQALALAT